MSIRLFDMLDEGIIVQATDGAVRDWNAAALGMLGVTAEQLRGLTSLERSWRISLDGEPARHQSDGLRELLQRARERGRVTVRIVPGVAPVRWVTVAAHTARDDGGAETHLSTLVDVTAQREAERENERYREIIGTLDASYRIVEESPIGICSVDADGQVLRSNLAFIELAGIDTTSIFPLIASEDRAMLRYEFARLIEGRIPSLRVETRLDRPGRERWCEITGVAMRRGTPGAAILLLIDDVTERRRRELRLRQLAEHDPLTGLHNRRSFERGLRDRLAALAPSARRACAEWSLLMIDLDGFKHVNDTCGHAVGDAVLVAVAAAIRDRTRTDDIVGRLGGDEFAVLFCSEPSDAIAVGRQIIERIAQAAAKVTGAPPVSASVGIVRLRAGRSAQETLRAADAAMYEAKRLGKACAVEMT